MSRFPSSINFTVNTTPNRTVGNFNKTSITLHWWDDPARRPQWGGVMSWLHNRSAQVSATYMTEAGRIAQLVPEKDVSWHSGHNTGNRHSIGIEVNPRLNAGDYEATAILVAEIWQRHGTELPLHPHRYWNASTACPGHLDINRVRRRARQINSGSTPTPASPAPVLEGEVMSARDVWRLRGLDYVNDSASTKDNQLARAHQYTRNVWSRIRSNDWREWLATGVMRWRGLDYVNENPSSKDAQIARAHQYSMLAAQRSREANDKIDAVADAVGELVGQIDTNTRKALEDRLANIKAENARASAADVAAELEVTVKEQED